MPAILEKGKGALTHKIGPLPLWGWAVGGAAAIFIVSRIRGGGGSASPAGSFGIPNIGTGASAPVSSVSADSFPIVNPAQNARAGSDTTIGGIAPLTVPVVGTQTGGGSGLSSNGSSGTAVAGLIPQALPTEVPATVAPGNVFQKIGSWFDVGPYREKIDANADKPVVMSSAVAAGQNQYTPELVAEIRKNNPGWTGPYSAPGNP